MLLVAALPMRGRDSFAIHFLDGCRWQQLLEEAVVRASFPLMPDALIRTWNGKPSLPPRITSPKHPLIKRDLHRLERDRLEVVNINAARKQLCLGVLRYKSRNEVGSNRKLLLGPVEERRHFTAVGHADLTFSKLVEEGMAESLDCCKTGAGSVLKKSRDEVDGIGRCARTEDLGEGVRSDLREFVLHVVGVHSLDLFSRRCTENLDDLHKLVDTALAGEKRLPLH